MGCAALAVMGGLVGTEALADRVVQVHGSGTTNPSKLFWRIFELFEVEVRAPIKMTYRAVGSSTGQAEYVAGVNHFGSGDIPLTATQFANLTVSVGAGHSLHLPVMVGEVGFFHNVPGLKGTLKLTGCVLAGIFQGTISTWDAAEIVQLNPEMGSLGQGKNITVVHRQLGSSSTASVTEYMKKNCPTGWTLSTGATITWPSDSRFNSAQGSGGVTKFLKANEWAIGYLDSGHGHGAGLAEVAVKNKDGNFLVSGGAGGLGSASMAVDAAMAANVFPSAGGGVVDFKADWSNVDIYDQAGNVTWPISLVTYVYVRTNVVSLAESGPLLRAFLEYLLSDRGQKLVEDFGFSPLPTSLRDAVRTAIGSLLTTDPSQTAYIFEDSTASVTGMGSHVVSFKRQNYAVIDRAGMAADIKALGAVTAAPATSVSADTSAYTRLTDLDPFLAFSVVLSVINAIVVVVLSCMVCGKGGRGSGSGSGIAYRL